MAAPLALVERATCTMRDGPRRTLAVGAGPLTPARSGGRPLRNPPSGSNRGGAERSALSLCGGVCKMRGAGYVDVGAPLPAPRPHPNPLPAGEGGETLPASPIPGHGRVLQRSPQGERFKRGGGRLPGAVRPPALYGRDERAGTGGARWASRPDGPAGIPIMTAMDSAQRQRATVEVIAVDGPGGRGKDDGRSGARPAPRLPLCRHRHHVPGG